MNNFSASDAAYINKGMLSHKQCGVIYGAVKRGELTLENAGRIYKFEDWDSESLRHVEGGMEMVACGKGLREVITHLFAGEVAEAQAKLNEAMSHYSF